MRKRLRYLAILLFPIACGAQDPASNGLNLCAPAATDATAGHAAITLDQALKASLSRRPELTVSDCEIRAADGRVLQAGLRPNPQASAEVENFAGSGSQRGFQSTETTLSVSQLIELGRKRAKRQSLATSERDLLIWDKEARRLEVITDIRKAFIETLASQARVALAEELANVARSMLRGVAEMVKAGKVSPIEESRATVATNRADLTVFEMRSQLTLARQHLAMQWGDVDARFERAEGSLDSLPARPELSELEQQINDHPALARWPDEMKRRKSELDLAAAEAIPNLAVSGGIRHFAGDDDVAMVVGVSVPLPLFNRNQGAILTAQANMDAADASFEVARRTLLTSIRDQYQALNSAAVEEESLRRNTLPLAAQVFEATSTGYRHGKFSLLEVLDAQRTLFESRSQYVEAQARYQIAIAELERLTAKSMQSVHQDKHSDAGETP
jgi:cobalt-zinc-cadmium efflux system outer membrane protein